MQKCYLLLFVGQLSAKALKCHSCLGTNKECQLSEVTCPGSNDTCGSSIMVTKSFPFKKLLVTKGCVSTTAPYRSISISPNDIIKMSIQEETCNTDLCNKETITEPEEKENERNCYSCMSPGKDCNSETMKNMKCRGRQNSCLDVRVLGIVGEITNIHLKGCGQLNCSNRMIFSSKTSSMFVKCCNENFCNSGIDFEEPDKTLNGIECYSCNTLSGEKCSPENVTKTQCYGSMTCMELAGIKMEDGKSTPAVLKGCATPNLCDNLVLPLLQNVRGSRVHCCNGSLCNNKFTEDNLQATGYFPGTGIQSCPTNQANNSGKDSGVKKPQNSYNSIKTGHASDNYDSDGTLLGEPGSDGNNSFPVLTDLDDSTDFSAINGNEDNFNYGSWDSNAGTTIPTSTSANGLSSSTLVPTSKTNVPTATSQSAEHGNIQNITAAHNNNTYLPAQQNTDSDFFFTGGDVGIVYTAEDDESKITATTQRPTNQGSWYVDSSGGETNNISTSSAGLNSDNNSNSTYEETTENDVFITTSEIDIFDIVDMYVEEYENNLTATSQGPTMSKGTWDNTTSESAYGLNSDPSDSSDSDIIQQIMQGPEYDDFSQQDEASLYSTGETISKSNSSGNNTVQSNGSYSAGVNSNLSTIAPVTKLGGNTTLLSSTISNSNITKVQSTSNSSSGAYGANVVHGNNPNKTLSIQYNCSSYTGGSRPKVNNTESQGRLNGSGPAVPANNGSSASNSGPGNNTMANCSSHFVNSNNDHVHNAPVTPQRNQNSNMFQSSGYTTKVYNTSFALPGNTNGHGNSSSSMGYHTEENSGNSNNVFSRSTTPGNHGTGNGSHSMPNNNGYGSGNGSGSGNNPVNKNNITENGLYLGNGTSRSNSSTYNNGPITPMPSGVTNNGSNNGTNLSNSTPGMTSTGGSYNGSPSSNHSTPGENHNGSFGYNGSHDYNSGHSYIGSNNSNITTGGGYFNNSNPKSNSTEHGLHNGNGTNHSNSSTYNDGYSSNVMPSNNGSNHNSSYFTNSTNNGSSHSSNNYGTGPTNGSNSTQKPPAAKNNSTEDGIYHGNGTSRNNSSTPHNGNYSTGGSYNGSSSNHSIYGGNQNGSFMLPPHGNNSSIYETAGNHSGNNFMPPPGSAHGGPYENLNNSDNPYWNYDPNMLPPVGNGPPEEYFFGNGYNSNGSYGTMGNGNSFMPPGGSSHGEPNSNSNNSGSSLWNNYPNMPPNAVPGHSGNNTYNINGFNFYQPPPGINGSTTGNYSNLINILANATGLSPNELSRRLNGTDISKPGNLAAALSGIPNLDLNLLPPWMKAAIHPYYNGPGSNYNMPPTKWNVSSFGGYDNVIQILATAAGVSPALLSQRLDGVNISNPRNIAGVLHSFPTFDANRLPTEMKAAIFGYNSNVTNVFPNSTGYNNNTLHPKRNISSLLNNSYFLAVVSNMTNISRADLSQRFNEWSKNNQSNLAALMFGLPGFNPSRLPQQFMAEFVGKDSNLNSNNTDGFNYNMGPPGSGYGDNGNPASDNNLTYYNGALSLRGKAGVLAIVFLVTLPLLN